MKISTFRNLLLLILLYSPATLAQGVSGCSHYPEFSPDRRRCEETMLQSARALAGTRFLEPDRHIMPKTPGAWVLHLITQGGFHGQGLPTVTVRSNGEYACGEAEPLEFKTLPDAQTRLLADLILWPEFRTPKKLTKMKPSEGTFCSDCYSGKIIFARLETDGKIRSYDSHSELGRYKEAVDKLSLIRDHVSEFVRCK